MERGRAKGQMIGEGSHFHPSHPTAPTMSNPRSSAAVIDELLQVDADSPLLLAIQYANLFEPSAVALGLSGIREANAIAPTRAFSTSLIVSVLIPRFQQLDNASRIARLIVWSNLRLILSMPYV